MIPSSCCLSPSLPIDMSFFTLGACNNATNVATFVDQSSAVPTQQSFPSAPISPFRCAPALNFGFTPTSPFPPSTSASPSLFGVGMKRKKPSDDSDPSPRNKRRHYEDRMSHRFNSLDLSGNSRQNENPGSPNFSITELDSVPLYDVSPMEDDSAPTVELPDDSSDEEDESKSSFEIGEELRRFLTKEKKSRFTVPSSVSRELVLYRAPSSPGPNSRNDSDAPLSARISEIPDNATESPATESPQDSSPSDDTMMDEGVDSGKITFPEDSTSGSDSRGSSPPSSSHDERSSHSGSGYAQAAYSDVTISTARRSPSDSSSSSDDQRHVFRGRQSTFAHSAVIPESPANDDPEPMDLD